MPTQRSRISSGESFLSDPTVTIDKIQTRDEVSVVFFVVPAYGNVSQAPMCSLEDT